MILVCPGRHAEALAAGRRPSHILSLASPDADLPAFTGIAAERLVLRFHDIAEPREGLTAPDAAMVARLLDFAAHWTAEAPLLIHCHAGVSRSTAAACAIACARSAPGEEAAIANRLRSLSPSATPNALIVALADRLLDRDGRMIAAVAGIGRGADCFEGEIIEFSAPLAPSAIVRRTSFE